MASNSSDLSLPDEFANIVRLFPLPNVVLFPGVVQALHLFEPRYSELAADAIANDNLITMAYIKPDWESGDIHQPEISQTVCVGKVLSHTLLDDGRYNMFLVGVKRATIVTELDDDAPYRMAEVEIIDDYVAREGGLRDLRDNIVSEFRTLASLRTSWNHEALEQFLSDDLPLGHLIDMICYSSGATPDEQMVVLETIELGQRGRIVLDMLKSQVAELQQTTTAKPDFPPGFSLN